MVCIIHAFPRESTGFGWVTDFPPQLSVLNGAVVIWLHLWIRWSWALTQSSFWHCLRFPQRNALACVDIHSILLASAWWLPGLSPWWRKHRLGTSLLMVLKLIKRHPWILQVLVPPFRLMLEIALYQTRRGPREFSLVWVWGFFRRFVDLWFPIMVQTVQQSSYSPCFWAVSAYISPLGGWNAIAVFSKY